MNKHLGVPINPLVEFFICLWRVLDRDLVADDEAGLRPTIDDQVA